MNRTVKEVVLDGRVTRVRVLIDSDDCLPPPDQIGRWQMAHLMRSVADDPSLLACDGVLQGITIRHLGSRWVLEGEFVVDRGEGAR